MKSIYHYTSVNKITVVVSNFARYMNIKIRLDLENEI